MNPTVGIEAFDKSVSLMCVTVWENTGLATGFDKIFYIFNEACNEAPNESFNALLKFTVYA